MKTKTQSNSGTADWVSKEHKKVWSTLVETHHLKGVPFLEVKVRVLLITNTTWS